MFGVETVLQDKTRVQSTKGVVAGYRAFGARKGSTHHLRCLFIKASSGAGVGRGRRETAQLLPFRKSHLRKSLALKYKQSPGSSFLPCEDRMRGPCLQEEVYGICRKMESIQQKS